MVRWLHLLDSDPPWPEVFGG